MFDICHASKLMPVITVKLKYELPYFLSKEKTAFGHISENGIQASGLQVDVSHGSG